MPRLRCTALRAWGASCPTPNLLIAPYVRLEAVLSSRIEGTQSGVTDLLRFEAGDDEGIAELRDEVEQVRNYVVALDHGIERLASGFPLSSDPSVRSMSA